MLVSKLSFVNMITKFQTYTVHVLGKLIKMMFYLSKKIFYFYYCCWRYLLSQNLPTPLRRFSLKSSVVFINDVTFIFFLLQEIILIVIFVIEYILRLWAAGCRSAYVGIKGRLWFAVKLYSIIGVLYKLILFVTLLIYLCRKAEAVFIVQ